MINQEQVNQRKKGGDVTEIGFGGHNFKKIRREHKMKRSYLKKLTFVCVILIAFVLMIWSTSPSIAGAAGKKPVKIGLLSPFSPPGDPAVGKRMLWAAELAIKYINEEMGGVLCGRPVELVVEDDAGTPADGIAGYRKLVQKDGVVAVVGQFHSSVCLAITKVAKDLGVPVFASGAASAKITETHCPAVFRILTLIPTRAKLWIDFAKEKGWKRLAVLAEDTDYGTGFGKWIEKYGTDGGVEVKTIVFPRTITDLTPALLETKAWKPDLVINVGIGAAGYLMVKQAYDIGLFPKVPMLASYGWTVRPEFWDAVGHRGKYILFSTSYKPGMNVSWLGEWMATRYKALHNEDPTYYFFNAFGNTLIVAQALNMAQSDDPKDLIKALTHWPVMNWSGVVKFEELPGEKWHNVSLPVVILQQTEVRQSLGDAHFVWPARLGASAKIEQP